jgi:translation initiation factor 1
MPESDFCLQLQKKRYESKSQIKSDGIIRIRREVKGRKGKTVTAITGFDLDDKALNLVSKQLKQHCGTGGSVKDGVVIIQGDHRDTIKSLLEGQGYIVKLAGG